MARYTAQEMRDTACRLVGEIEVNSPVADSVIDRASAMLLQAADMMERENKKYQYQYAARYFYPSGVIATDYISFDNPTVTKLFSKSRDGTKKIICRREVGEWEEVPNED